MAKFIPAILFLLSSASAFADFSGNWNGSAEAKDSGSWSAHCPSATFKFTQNASSFHLVNGSVDCGAFKENWYPIDLVINGQDLFYKGEKVGTITATSFSTTYTGPTNLTEIYHMELSSTGIVFEQHLIDANGKENLSLHGNLTK